MQNRSKIIYGNAFKRADVQSFETFIHWWAEILDFAILDEPVFFEHVAFVLEWKSLHLRFYSRGSFVFLLELNVQVFDFLVDLFNLEILLLVKKKYLFEDLFIFRADFRIWVQIRGHIGNLRCDIIGILDWSLHIFVACVCLRILY